MNFHVTKLIIRIVNNKNIPDSIPIQMTILYYLLFFIYFFQDVSNKNVIVHCISIIKMFVCLSPINNRDTNISHKLGQF